MCNLCAAVLTYLYKPNLDSEDLNKYPQKYSACPSVLCAEVPCEALHFNNNHIDK